MAKLVILTTSKMDEAHTVGEAWQQAGVPGVTYIEGYGLRRMQETVKDAEVMPGMLSMIDILRNNEETSLILMSAVNDDALVDRMLASAQEILGEMTEPNAGIFLVVDLERAIGIRHHDS